MAVTVHPNPSRNASLGKRVLLLISPAKAYGRDVLEGIIRHNELHERWQLRLGPLRPTDVRKAVREVDGVIAEARHRGILERLSSPRPPVVIVTGDFRPGRLPMVVADNEASGRLAASYFHERGLRHLAFVGHPDTWFSRVRQLGFTRQGRELGLSCSSCLRRRHSNAGLRKWLLGLPRPVGLLAMNLDTAKVVCDACMEAELRVPEEVAILGVDRDDVTSHLSVPPLSTIDMGVDRIGSHAAALLAELIRGEQAPREPVVVPPVGVIECQSTDVLAVEDADLARAIRFIRGHATDALRVADILAAIPVSRRKLEMGFRRVLGRTIEQEIRRVRLETARRLLIRTDLPVAVVADRSGFGTSAHLGNVFRRDLGMTPNECRRGRGQTASQPQPRRG